MKSATWSVLVFCLLSFVAQAQEPAKAIVDMALGEKPAETPQALDLTALPSDWWAQFDGATAQQLGERASQFELGIEERIQGLGGDDLITAQNGIANVKSLFELLAVAKQGPSEDHFEPIPSSETYFLADFLSLRARERELTKRKAQVTLQIEQTENQFDLLQERRDNLLRQYDATPPESPSRILVGISRVSARVEYELALTRTGNLRQRLKKIDEQSQLLSEQETYARMHLVSSDMNLTGVQNEVREARAKVAAMSEKVAAMQPLLLEVLSAEPVNPSLEMLRKQQMTRAVAEAELSQLREALAQAKSNWYQFKASGAEYNFNLHATAVASRQLTAEALRQAELWSSICQSTLIASPPAANLNAVKNFELAQTAARETLELIDDIRNASDDLLLIQDLLSQEVIDSQSGLKNAWVRVVLVASNGWDRLVEMADFNLFEIGDTPVTPAGIFKMLLILILAFGISWLIRYLLNRGVSADKVSQRAAAYTLGRLLHYIVILVGVFAALSSIGIDFTSFALIAGALSVGIGFGLQAIVNNFVSGLILLFEGTLRVGDYIELDSGLAGIVKEINTRATVVNTNDSVDVVVPNSELVTTKLTNWTLREPVARIHIAFGVAYGSDKELVKKVALEAAAETEFALLHQPGREPQLRLVKFGENAMEFEMRVWVSRQGVRRPYRVRSSFLWALESGFQANHIRIPFPQRDIHVRSDFRVDPQRTQEPVAAPLPQADGE